MADKDYTFTIVTKDEGGDGGGGGKKPQPWDYQDEGGKMLRPGQAIPEQPQGTGETRPEDPDLPSGQGGMGGGGGFSLVGRPGDADEDDPHMTADEPDKSFWTDLLGGSVEKLGGVFTGGLNLLGSLIGGIPGPPDQGLYDPSGQSMIRGTQGIVRGAGQKVGGTLQTMGDKASMTGEAMSMAGASGGGMAMAGKALGVAGLAVTAFAGAIEGAIDAVAKWASFLDNASNEMMAFSPELMNEKITTSIDLLMHRINRAQKLGGEMAEFEAAKRDAMLEWEDFKTHLMQALLPFMKKAMKFMAWLIDRLDAFFKWTMKMLGNMLVAFAALYNTMHKAMTAWWKIWTEHTWITELRRLGKELINMNWDEEDRRNNPLDTMFDIWFNNPNIALGQIQGPEAGIAPGGANPF